MEASPEGTVQVEFSIGVGTRSMDASLSVPERSISLTEMLPVLQTLSNNIIDHTASGVESEGRRISCKAGCGACCRQLVALNIFEAEALTVWIGSLPPHERQTLESRFHGALLALRDGGILARLDFAATNDRESNHRLALDYLELGVPCPFLVDESCGIHPIRPMICREYLVTSPSKFCASPSANQVVTVPMPLKLSRVLARLGAQIEHNSQGWIPLVFLFAWMKSGARPGDVIRGPGPELLYEIVKLLAAS